MRSIRISRRFRTCADRASLLPLTHFQDDQRRKHRDDDDIKQHALGFPIVRCVAAAPAMSTRRTAHASTRARGTSKETAATISKVATSGLAQGGKPQRRNMPVHGDAGLIFERPAATNSAASATMRIHRATRLLFTLAVKRAPAATATHKILNRPHSPSYQDFRYNFARR